MGNQQVKSSKEHWQLHLKLGKQEIARQQIITSTMSELDILKSLRDGSKEYDFKNAKIIKEGGQATVIEITSKIDGKTYAAKKLKYKIG